MTNQIFLGFKLFLELCFIERIFGSFESQIRLRKTFKLENVYNQSQYWKLVFSVLRNFLNLTLQSLIVAYR